MKNEEMEPIVDPEKIRIAQDVLVGLVEGPHHLRLDALRERSWAAVPVESASHFEEGDAQALSAAIGTHLGHSECLGVATEPLEDSPLCFHLPTTLEGLLAFSWECGSFDFALLTTPADFVVLCTTEDYYIVAGPQDFVTAAVGGDIRVARARFLSFASDEQWPEQVRRDLMSVHERYCLYDGPEEAGTR